MKKTKRRLLLIPAAVLLIVLCSVSLFFVSKSRSFQFFGELIASVPNGDKKIALTFDDGPTGNTGLILNKLDELQVKATFFVCGIGIDARPEDAEAIVRAGHELGNHSYSHQRMILKSYDFCREEIDRTNKLIRMSGYDGEIFFRPPYGKKLFVLPYVLDRIGMKTVMWSMEPETVLGNGASPDEIARYVTGHTESGSVILLHPMYNTANVLAALDILVPELRERGYEFYTVSDLYTQYH